MNDLNNDIRRKISAICQPTTGATKKEQYQEIKDQNDRIENELGILSEPLHLTQDQEVDVNCHAYSLGVWRSKFYFTVNKKVQEITRNRFQGSTQNSAPGFLMKLLIDDAIISESNPPKPGDIILYNDNNGNPLHSGILEEINGGKIIIKSKWGGLKVFKHGLWQIQPDYGSNPPKYYIL